MLNLDPVTRASMDAQPTTATKAQAVLAAFANPVTVKVLNGAGATMGTGTLSTPWATVVNNTLNLSNVTSFSVTTSGTPDSTWKLRFESGTRWMQGSFGLDGSGQEFTWTLPSWTSGQLGQIQNATAVVWKGVTESDVVDTYNVADGVVVVFQWTNLSSKDIGSNLEGVQYIYDLNQDVSNPQGLPAVFTKISGPSYISVSSGGSLVVSTTASAGAYSVVVDLARG